MEWSIGDLHSEERVPIDKSFFPLSPSLWLEWQRNPSKTTLASSRVVKLHTQQGTAIRQ